MSLVVCEITLISHTCSTFASFFFFVDPIYHHSKPRLSMSEELIVTGVLTLCFILLFFSLNNKVRRRRRRHVGTSAVTSNWRMSWHRVENPAHPGNTRLQLLLALGVWWWSGLPFLINYNGVHCIPIPHMTLCAWTICTLVWRFLIALTYNLKIIIFFF